MTDDTFETLRLFLWGVTTVIAMIVGVIFLIGWLKG